MSLVSAALMPDYTGKDASSEYSATIWAAVTEPLSGEAFFLRRRSAVNASLALPKVKGRHAGGAFDGPAPRLPDRHPRRSAERRQSCRWGRTSRVIRSHVNATAQRSASDLERRSLSMVRGPVLAPNSSCCHVSLGGTKQRTRPPTMQAIASPSGFLRRSMFSGGTSSHGAPLPSCT